MRLLPATSVLLLLSTASFAAEPFHVVAPSFGCVDARSTWLLNETHDRRRHDPQWVERAMDRGQCSLVSPTQEWHEIGPVGGLILMRPALPQAGPPLLFRRFDLRHGLPVVQAELPPPVTVSPVPAEAATQPVAVMPPVAIPPASALPALPPVARPAAQASPDPAASAPARPADAASSSSPAGPASPQLPAPLPATVAEPSLPTMAALPAISAAVAPNPLQAPLLQEMRGGRPVVIGAAAVVLAALLVLGLRRLIRYRVVKRHRERSVDEWLDTQPAFGGDRLDPAAPMATPTIDDVAYRQRCVKSLGEAGWQARMSLPAGRLTADIIARRDGCLLTVQCRPSMQPLEAAVVQEALVVRSAQDAQLAAVVSNAGYTEAARTLANANGVRLLHETELPEFTS